MKIIKSLLFIIASIVISYLVWLMFYFLTPEIMKLSWWWYLIIFIVAGSLLTPLIGFIPGLLSVPVSFLRSSYLLETIVVLLVLGFFIFDSCKTAWAGWLVPIGFKQIVYSLTQNILVLGVFWGVGLTLLSTEG